MKTRIRVGQVYALVASNGLPIYYYVIDNGMHTRNKKCRIEVSLNWADQHNIKGEALVTFLKNNNHEAICYVSHKFLRALTLVTL